MSNLKPCPVCNEEAQKFFGYDYGKVGCRNEDCNYRDRPQYVEQWNNRPHEDQTRADAVRECKEHLYDEFSYLNEIGEAMEAYANKLEKGAKK
jgi:hypothetical protein